MKKTNKFIAFALGAAIGISSCACALFAPVVTAYADEAAPKAVTTGSGKLSDFTQTFTEDWQGGLDTDKWQVHKYKDDYVDDFKVVDDPTGAMAVDENGNSTGEVNKVITYSRNGTLLIPTDDYWPVSGLKGRIDTINMRMRLDGLEVVENNRSSEGSVGMAVMSNGNFTTDSVSLWWITKYQSTNIFFVSSDTMTSGNRVTHKWDQPYYCTPGEDFIFDYSDWFDVSLKFVPGGEKILIEITDKNGEVMYCSRTVRYFEGKYAIGGRFASKAENYNNDVNTNGTTYIDDIEIKFRQSTMDTDEGQKDVNVYYAGNTFYKPGNSISITGEQLGTTVKSAKIKKLNDACSSDLQKAKYVAEQNYLSAKESNVSWNELDAVAGSEIELPIIQGTTGGLNFFLPNGLGEGEPECYKTDGAYAIYLEAAETDGKDALVIVNNPEIKQVMHNDGDAATAGGWLKLTGSNISVKNSDDAMSAVIIDKNGSRTLLDSSYFEVDTTENNNGKKNDYFAKITVPANLAAGDYQLMLNNGYGGDYGWSEPVEFKVVNETQSAIQHKIANFNVLDYGAVGDGKINDTAAIASALAAAEKSGGGTVYLPKGVYRVSSTLYVPNNVSIIGESMQNTCIYYDECGNVKRFDLFVYNGNFELANVYLYGSNVGTIIKRSNLYSSEAGKVYVHDVYSTFDAYRKCSQGGNTNMLNNMGQLEAQLWVRANYPGIRLYNNMDASVSEKFVTFENVEFDQGNYITQGYSIGSSSQYLYCNNLSFEKYNSAGASKAAIFEDCKMGTPCLAASAIYKDCTFSDNRTNNRELILTDGDPSNNTVQIQPLLSSYSEDTVKGLLYEELLGIEETLKDKTEAEVEQAKAERVNAVMQFIKTHGEDCTYKILSTKYTSGSHKTMYVYQGLGFGQIRNVVDSIYIGEYSYIAVNEKFAVTPNRNSRVFFHSKRYPTFITNCTFRNGISTSTYGTGVDWVWDGNEFDRTNSGPHFTVRGCAVWYWSAVNNNAKNIVSGTSSGVEYRAAGVETNSGQRQNGILGILYRSNTVGNGGGFNVASISNARPWHTLNVIFEDNVINSDKVGINSAFDEAMDGLLLKNNRRFTTDGGETVEKCAYSNNIISNINKHKNSGGYYRLYCPSYSGSSDGYTGDVENRAIGDVNNDGKISLKDITVLRYWLAGLTDDAQIKALYGEEAITKFGDMNEDGSTDSRDIFAIRLYLIDPDNWKDKVGKSEKPEDDKPTQPTGEVDSKALTNPENWEIKFGASGTPVWDNGSLTLAEKGLWYGLNTEKVIPSGSDINSISYTTQWSGIPQGANNFLLFFGVESASKFSAIKIVKDASGWVWTPCEDGKWNNVYTSIGDIDLTQATNVTIEYLADNKVKISLDQGSLHAETELTNTLPKGLVFLGRSISATYSDFKIKLNGGDPTADVSEENWELKFGASGTPVWDNGSLTLAEKGLWYGLNTEKAISSGSDIKSISYTTQWSGIPQGANNFLLFFGVESSSKFSAIKIVKDASGWVWTPCEDGKWNNIYTSIGDIDLTQATNVTIEYLADNKVKISLDQGSLHAETELTNTLPKGLVFLGRSISATYSDIKVTLNAGDPTASVSEENWELKFGASGTPVWNNGSLTLAEKGLWYGLNNEKALPSGSDIKSISYTTQWSDIPQGANSYLLFLGVESSSKFSALKIVKDASGWVYTPSEDGKWGGYSSIGDIDFTEAVNVTIEYLDDNKVKVSLDQGSSHSDITISNTLPKGLVLLGRSISATYSDFKVVCK